MIRKTADGLVRGRIRDGLHAWRGIPYAAPPAGPLRFRAPQPVLPWSGVRDAAEFGASSPQRGARDGDENCLALNVLTPAGEGAPRPVMVFIHGGAYVTGSSATDLYRGDHLVRRGDIVYVSINYRLGALGYLDFSEFSTADTTFESNVGLRDQIAALQWVQRNIAEFGGDPDNVTIFGESSGGNAVTTLMCVPAARGLFARGIAESPPVASAYGTERAHRWARELVGILGADGANAAEALRSATPQALIGATHALTLRCADSEPGTRATAPVVDGDLLPRHPLDAFADGSAAPLPLIIGTNSHEGRFFPLFLNIIPTDRDRIEKMFDETDPAVKARAIASYPGYPRRRASADLGGDVVFWEPSILAAQGHTVYAPTYSYRYDFAPRALRLAGMNATHGTELLAVFGAVEDKIGRAATLLGGRAALRAVTDTVQSHWLEFARTGTPGPAWPQYSVERRETLVIDEISRVEPDPDGDRRRAWIGYHHRR